MSIDREHLRELTSGATPGPWEAGEPHGWGDGDDKPQSCIETPAGVLTWDDHGGEVFEPADAEFIAAARTAVPALLDMLDQAEAERDWNLSSSRLAKEERIKANARADQAEAERDHVRAQVGRVRELLTKWVDEYGDPVYHGNGWAEGVRDAAREALKALDGER